jgi:hypothetical protein
VSHQTKITKSANGRSCTIRSPWCNDRTDTTVWCHAPSGMVFGRGISHKSLDPIGCYGCCECHDAIDARNHVNETTYEERRTMFLRGFGVSFRLLLDQGLVVVT